MTAEIRFEPEGESVDDQSARARTMFDAALETLREARARLALDLEAAEVLDASRKLWEEDFPSFRIAAIRRRRSPTPQSLEDEERTLEAMKTGIQRMEELAADQLAKLEQPISA